MTHRQARRRLGSRTVRRAGTKTRVIPPGNGKRPPKYRTRRASRGKKSLAARVAALVKTGDVK